MESLRQMCNLATTSDKRRAALQQMKNIALDCDRNRSWTEVAETALKAAVDGQLTVFCAIMRIANGSNRTHHILSSELIHTVASLDSTSPVRAFLQNIL